MKYIAILDTDEFKDFKFFEDADGKYLAVKDANSESNEWLPLHFKALDSCDDAISEVEKLPPVIPQPKMGRWLIVDDCEHFMAKCSECGRIEDSRMINKYPYCHCGTKMQEVKG